MKTLIPSLAFALFLTACATDETITGQLDTGNAWVLQTMNGAPATTRITLLFPKKGQVAGQAPCNSYGASQKAPLPWFDLGPIRATKLACGALELETQYLDLLAKMTLIEVRETSLLLTNDDGQSLQFSRE